ncbi:hypothetical protein EGT07_26270 [Herbaspirillum sp. HC18]|nr:hypothetical protein EGT07_26270 [Herbaspirillum sp. HC18]
MSEKTDFKPPMPQVVHAVDLNDIRVEKYKRTRYWAVWVGDRLLAVTVYKKGAVAIKETLLPTKCVTSA